MCRRWSPQLRFPVNHDLDELNLAAWVCSAPMDQRNFREAVHIVLTAIGESTSLRSKMIMKGGLLMAIRYESTRFTRDVDFSTRDRYAKGDELALLNELETQLVVAADRLPYDTICRRQSMRVDPTPPQDHDFPGIKLKIGFAPRSNRRALERLINGQSPNVVEIDHSYNESVSDVEILRLSDGRSIQAYSYLNLVAEKIRSLIQHPIRIRNREQDVYDLYLLLRLSHSLSEIDRTKLVKIISSSCASRFVPVSGDALLNPMVRQMAEKGYAALSRDIIDPMPDFSAAYERVESFFSGLPWPK
jgi:predicted nucleotidyltransferase component of viral defense system